MVVSSRCIGYDLFFDMSTFKLIAFYGIQELKPLIESLLRIVYTVDILCKLMVVEDFDAFLKLKGTPSSCAFSHLCTYEGCDDYHVTLYFMYNNVMGMNKLQWYHGL